MDRKCPNCHVPMYFHEHWEYDGEDGSDESCYVCPECGRIEDKGSEGDFERGFDEGEKYGRTSEKIFPHKGGRVITRKQKLQALDESILLQEVMMMLFRYKAGERTAEYVAEDIIKLVRESYKQPKSVQSDDDKQYKKVSPVEILDEMAKLGTVSTGGKSITIGKWVISIGRKYEK